MHLTRLADIHGDKPAVILADTGETISYRELETRSNQIAQLFRSRGLRAGDHIAILLENCVDYFPIAWAAQRSGLYYTPVNWHLHEDEAAYIVDNCQARMLLHSSTLNGRTIAATAPSVEHRLLVGDRRADGSADQATGAEWLDDALRELPAEPITDESEGYYMFYSSGTTGRPKGILPTRTPSEFGSGLPIDHRMATRFGFCDDTVFLNTGPLYHAAPLAWCLGTLRNGGTTIITGRFDPAGALRTIETYRVTHAMFVPTMFVRMLKLDTNTRQSADVSSLRLVIHSAAPCPVEVKRAMIEWFGHIIVEFYGASEGTGFFMIDADEWLAHPGSVGRPLIGTVHICDDDGLELGTGAVGTVWFEGVGRFTYHGDPQRTAQAFDHRGWTTLGDLGHVDEQGYLYLSSRRTDLIISGGVNIYPTEIEDVLIAHESVLDVAVIGVPDVEMGQIVHAIVTPVAERTHDPTLTDELLAYCRDHLSRFKCPRSVSIGIVPRSPSGKIVRRHLTSQAAQG
ncbi:MAG: AMP-binding protein [Gordonia sp. (in: high G+C Gram-positive bacteria)]